ncbi:cytochrome P450 [Emericellopsis atlantica]|uniref:Benzoate 4-monooxygenase bphA n=1 Tax=Emericellopsis atlantica TaxID=2614577 RepID=A0A9P7ZD06_9HYPO|nr:cytochrome P450 [Emericellopsis atlantica]KAG9249760.1 cytochrome P450 [Emericellopsis atlantica]
MSILTTLSTPWVAVVAIVVLVTVYYVTPYLTDNAHLRGIPGPPTAAFSNIWLLSVCRRGKRFAIVHDMHRKLGPVVRIAPNHVSIADADAINTIYGHGNGFLKSDFYDAFVSIRRGLFNTRDRAEHTRKRKLVSHIFAPKSVTEFEPYLRQNLEEFVRQWDKLIKLSPHSQHSARLDCLSWFNYLAFDTIADLAFGKPFGMLTSGADIAEIRTTPTSPPLYAPAVEIINRRGEVSATLGIMPFLKPYARYLPDPFFSKGLEAVERLAGIAIARVSDRLENPPDISRQDLLARLVQGKDEDGQPLGREELTAEALTQLIAGSDTTSNSSCALLYHVVKTEGVLAKLQQELDAAVPDDVDVPMYEQVKSLPYLEQVISETLRHHSTSGIGLPREVPPNSAGVTIRGRHYGPGSVLSVPTYTVHHDKSIWGEDADQFNPSRWENPTAEMKKAFIPFSHGPRSCVGRNLAEIQMKLIAATWIKRYDVFLEQEVMETREGFLRKPTGLNVRIQRRRKGGS